MTTNDQIYSFFYLQEIHKILFLSNPISAYLYHKDQRVNLLTGKKEKFDIKRLDFGKWKDIWLKPRVTHFFYEYEILIRGEHVESHVPLIIDIEYQKRDLLDTVPSFTNVEFSSLLLPNRKSYEEKFKVIQNFLQYGECYQVNLTMNFKGSFQAEVDDLKQSFFAADKKLSAYAHGTWIPILNKFWLSNSPECLFQKKDSYIYSMPIKGTQRIEGSKTKAWEKLKSSEKNQAELYMIADLLRNDIARIDKPFAKIIAKKKMLEVPGLLHQYALISQELGGEIPLHKVIHSLFPGGSITGAPKKRVSEIIQKIENEKRGFYCGSTLFMFASGKSCSINIRSMEFDFNSMQFSYGSGGGVTLASEAQSEFEEMNMKFQSFLKIFNS